MEGSILVIFMCWNDQPLYKIPASCFHFLNDSLDFTARGPFNDRNLLFSLVEDPDQLHPIQDPACEEMLINKLSRALADLQAPAEQWERLGISPCLD